jgi:hypothetical protein
MNMPDVFYHYNPLLKLASMQQTIKWKNATATTMVLV